VSAESEPKPEPVPGDSELRAKLRSEVLPARWPDLLYQFARGGLFMVDPAVDLLDVAEALASDDRACTEQLLAVGALRRASDDDARSLQANPEQRLQFVIVQPWVLAQRLG
jgi:hypothetical protein